MFIVSPLGETVKGYLKRYGKKSPPIKLNCPCCARRLRRHGHYHRWVASRRRRYRIPIYRQFCPGCGKTFSLLPPFLRPYAQFITALREAAARRYILLERPLGEVAARIAAPQVGEVSQRTLLRWFRHLVATAPGVNTGLARLILELAPGADLMATGPPGRDRSLYSFPGIYSATLNPSPRKGPSGGQTHHNIRRYPGPPPLWHNQAGDPGNKKGELPWTNRNV